MALNDWKKQEDYSGYKTLIWRNVNDNEKYILIVNNTRHEHLSPKDRGFTVWYNGLSRSPPYKGKVFDTEEKAIAYVMKYMRKYKYVGRE